MLCVITHHNMNTTHHTSKILFSALLIFIIQQTSAQTWMQKANLTGIQRATSVGFSIDSVAYVGLGYNFNQSPIQQNDLWKYSPITDSWTQVASLPSSGLSAASAFSIGSKGYVAGGMNSSSVTVNNLWEYDALLNTWTQKTSCPGAGRHYAVAFSIGTKGYFGTGDDGSANLSDFWEYDPQTDSWLQRLDVPGLARSSAIGFGIGNKGYVGSGYCSGPTFDFYQFDPQSNTWTPKASMGNLGISDATCFVIGGEGYVCTGYVNSNTSDQLLEYDTLTDTWTTLTNCTGGARSNACGFAVANKGYVSCGNDASFSPLGDCWEYTPSSIATSAGNEIKPANAFAVFPAVTSCFVSVHGSIPADGALLCIINTSGQTLIKKTFCKDEILDVSSLASGVYFVNVKTSVGNFSRKFIKE